MPVIPNPDVDFDNEPARKGWAPTKKWLVALATSVLIVLVSGLESGFDEEEGKLALALATPLALAYIKSNDDTPGGVPLS